MPSAALTFSSVNLQVMVRKKAKDIVKLHRVIGHWDEDRMKLIDLFNKRIRQNNQTRIRIINIDETILEYNQVFG